MNTFNTGTEDYFDVRSISSWILHHLEEATSELGEEVISAIKENINYNEVV